MLAEARRPIEDVVEGDTVRLPPKGPWRVVGHIAEPDNDDIVWMTFADGRRHGFQTGTIVHVRRGSARAPSAKRPRLAPSVITSPAVAPVQPARVPRRRGGASAAEPTPEPRTSKPRSGLAEVARLLAPPPLDYAERCELLRLRQCNLQVSATLVSEREELGALHAELQRELEQLRALTQDQPLSHTIDPVTELYWRRPLAEAAREENARKKREAAEERFVYLRQKRDRDRDLAKRMAAAHTTLTAAERQQQDLLRENWAEHDDRSNEPETEPMYSTEGDCGRMHLSLLAACACANVRRREAERARPLPTSSTAKPATSRPPVNGSPATRTPVPARAGVSPGLSPAVPPPAPNVQRTPATMPTSPARSPAPPHELGAQVSSAPREQVVPGLGTRICEPPEQPVPRPSEAQRGKSPPAPRAVTSTTPTSSTLVRAGRKVAHSPLAQHILIVARDSNHMSVNGIVKALAATGYGARRQDVYAEVGAMLTDGRLVKIHDVIKPG